MVVEKKAHRKENNYVVLRDGYIIAFSHRATAEKHRHPLFQMFLMCEGVELYVEDKKVDGNCVVVDSNVFHKLINSDSLCVTVLFDPTSDYAGFLREKHINSDMGYGLICELDDFCWKKNDSEMHTDYLTEYAVIEKEIWRKIAFSNGVSEIDHRVLRAKMMIDNELWDKKSVTEIANELYLSESRLSHLFKEEYKISMEAYIVLTKWRRALKMMLEKGNITEAAYVAGFSSSSHFAKANKKFTGMNAKIFSKDSRFIQF